MSDLLFTSLIFLLCSSLISAMSNALQKLGRASAEALATEQLGFAKFIFQKSKRDLLTYALSFTKHLLLICYAISASLYAFAFLQQPLTFSTIVLAIVCIIAASLLSDLLFRALGLIRPRSFFKATCQICALILLLFWPLASLFNKLLKSLFPAKQQLTPHRIKDKIQEILQESESALYLDQNDQKMITSVLSFREKIAREVMVPRIDVATLSADTPIKEAAQEFLNEGYSRMPVWKENMDNIIGALYYKDLLNIYFAESPKALDRTIEHLLKPIVYAPETKKISHLLQEFRTKKIHLAIVVDEYGGTEGIVTIEDILEELVGEIADEYDFAEEALYSPLPSGGWVVDAKMTIIDIEEELGISIPQSPEYDTIGGFIFHKAGAIPSKGWRLHQDEFDIEVLSSSERAIEKIRITPR